MTVRGVARLAFGVVRDWARGVALCTTAAFDQFRTDVHTLTHLAEAIRDGCTPPDELLAVYEAHRTPYEDVTHRDGVAWR